MDKGKKTWLDERRNVDKLFAALGAACAALALAGFLLVAAKDVHVIYERWVAFFAAFGFLSYSFIVFAGKFWRKLVMREEDYYDR